MVVYQEMGVGSAASVLVFMMVAGVAAVFLYIGRIAEPKEKQA
jgi:trehalose/maltose transport system permease protein